jgi:twinkle protein
MSNTALKFVTKYQPCPNCGSSDARSINNNGTSKCFSCQKWFKPSEIEQTIPIEQDEITVIETNVESEGVYASLSDRKISVETAKKYGVKVSYDTKGIIDKHHYPYTIENGSTSFKVRKTKEKDFYWKGTPKDTQLFGQNLFKEGGKYITIVEGECDAMAAYELLGSKWPVVSVKNGAGGAISDIKENLEYIESFEHVVICFDTDKHGKEASQQVARLLKPGKAKIYTLPTGYKDANDMLKKNQHINFAKCWWDAKVYTPTGIIRVSEKQDEFLNRDKKDSVPYPWRGLNKKLFGMRQGELVTLTGGTGLGKSSITREIEHWLVNTTEDNVGIIALEEDWKRTVDGILSIETNSRLYIDHIRDDYSEEFLKKTYHKVFGNDNVFIHAHFGTNDIEAIFNKLRYLIIGCDCKWVIVDHLHMLVSSLAEGDERRAIDNIMTRLRSMVEETGAGLILVSHLRRVEGNRGHENGVEVNLSHLRGSQAIAQLSDCVIALERNQQSDDELESRTTKLRVLKSRYTGDVGMATALVYDPVTGRLAENYDELFADDKEVDF